VFPEMPPEPPPEYVAFVARRLADARAEAGRLTGADRFADEVYPPALADVATRWRWRGLRRFDEDRLLERRLAVHARRWREDRMYPVEVVAVRRAQAPGRFASVALRKAGLLPPTARPWERPAAEAAIAWAAAYRRYLWRRWTRIIGTAVVVLIAIMAVLPGPPP
jgi:hypothetical protein